MFGGEGFLTHISVVCMPIPVNQMQNLWERACSRKRFNIQRKCRLSVRLREQARSHMDCAFSKT
ncbi:hypothetical protein C5612_24170 [Pseudomonas frederiksbergensis]|uniref:Uncharacterized protein n=1 Tax=Pseudomonas frederiksbergensis TaxID=104087 RepID=A0A2S8HC81_9PSED|nr:hypothetical protein C5612_24170 [Pseudomonas frederiksbergensis]